MRDMFTKGRQSGTALIGRSNGSAKVDEEIVRYIRARSEAGYSLRQIAREVPVNFQTVHRIVKRVLWAHVE